MLKLELSQEHEMVFSQVFYVNYHRFFKYDPSLHNICVKKFLAWPDLIIVGPQALHKDLYTCFCELYPTPPPSPDSLIAAGGDCFLVDDRLIIECWSSYGFDLSTPDRIKPYILKALQIKAEIVDH